MLVIFSSRREVYILVARVDHTWILEASRGMSCASVPVPYYPTLHLDGLVWASEWVTKINCKTTFHMVQERHLTKRC